MDNSDLVANLKMFSPEQMSMMSVEQRQALDIVNSMSAGGIFVPSPPKSTLVSTTSRNLEKQFTDNCQAVLSPSSGNTRNILSVAMEAGGVVETGPAVGEYIIHSFHNQFPNNNEGCLLNVFRY
jgi:hypothetical protein